MIEVKINDESFAYDIHSLIQAFYPGKEVQVREKETFTEDSPLKMEAEIGEAEIRFLIYENGICRESGTVSVEDPDRKAVKNQLKKLLYQKL